MLEKREKQNLISLPPIPMQNSKPMFVLLNDIQ